MNDLVFRLLAEQLAKLKKPTEEEAHKLKNQKAQQYAVGALTDVGALTGSAITATQPPEGDLGQGFLGGALSGIGGGPLSMLFSGIAGLANSGRKGEDYAKMRDQQQAINIHNKTISYEDGGIVPGMGIQAELGEAFMLPNGDIVDTLAEELHKDMKEHTITDILNDSMVFSNKPIGKISEKNDLLYRTPGVYSEIGNEPMSEVKLTDIVDEDDTFSDAVKKVRKKIPTREENNDILTIRTNVLNKETRIPYLLKLIELQNTKNKNKQEQVPTELPIDGGSKII